MSAEKNLNHPSTSRPFHASYERRTSSARSGGAASSAIGPFLSEAFGGSTGLVDVPPSDHTRDHAVHPFVDQRPPFCNDAGATSRTALLAIDGIDDAVTQIDDSLDRNGPVVERVCPLFQLAARRVGCRRGMRDRRRLQRLAGLPGISSPIRPDDRACPCVSIAFP